MKTLSPNSSAARRNATLRSLYGMFKTKSGLTKTAKRKEKRNRLARTPQQYLSRKKVWFYIQVRK
jgi:hypothetical protein